MRSTSAWQIISFAVVAGTAVAARADAGPALASIGYGPAAAATSSGSLASKPLTAQARPACSGYFLEIDAPTFLADRRTQVTLTDNLYKEVLERNRCYRVFVENPSAQWRSHGGKIMAINSGTQALFSALKAGTYTVNASANTQYGSFRASATVTVQRNPYDETVLSTFTCTQCGRWPLAGVIADRNGVFYGTTRYGGSGTGCSVGCGTVFKLVPGASGYTTSSIYSFLGAPDGMYPYSRLVLGAGGVLYGTTSAGGASGLGTVFKLTPNGSGYAGTILYSFKGGADGATPLAGLIAGPHGKLIGTTAAGGEPPSQCSVPASAIGCGTVFELTPNGSGYVESVLHGFKGGSDGAEPYAALTVGRDGTLFGATYYGGGGSTTDCASYGCGTVFAMTPSSGGYNESVVYGFKGGNDAGGPQTGLTMDANGALYGTTIYGGGPQYGTAFKLTPNGSQYSESVIYVFQSADDGFWPSALTVGAHGKLYGTTYYGGGPLCGLMSGCGTVFALTPTGSTYSKSVLRIFGGADDGANPVGGLLLGPDRLLYGTTQLGTSYNGTVFDIRQ